MSRRCHHGFINSLIGGAASQLIRLVQEKVGMGNERMRTSRLPVAGAEREYALRVIEQALADRPAL